MIERDDAGPPSSSEGSPVDDDGALDRPGAGRDGPGPDGDPASGERTADGSARARSDDDRSAEGGVADGRVAGGRSADGRSADGHVAGEDRADGDPTDLPPDPPPGAADVFGPGLERAMRYAALLAGPGREQGVIGPRELPRLWERHLLNCAVLGEVVPAGAQVLDVGSGAGLPGIPLALARPDLTVTLLEPTARRIAWLESVVAELALPVAVVRGRAEERETRRRCGESDVVTARAVAPMGRLAGWVLPLVRPGGILAAMKGASAQAEVERDAREIRAAGGADVDVVTCGVGDAATHVVVVHRTERRGAGAGASPGSGRRARSRKDRTP